MFRFVHAADVHLDSPMVGLDRYASAPVENVRGATRRAFGNLVDLAIGEGVAFVLLAGDLYDGDWKDYRTGHFFVAQMVRLREARIPVLVISGNHDAQSQITKGLRPPDNVAFFSTKGPETRIIEAYGVAVHGQGYPTRAVTEDLAAAYPPADGELFHIGMLHTGLEGRRGHARYAPTSVTTLAQKGYHYWALGHVHAREVVSREPWIVFPGNTQGRHANESGPKGCTLVTVEDGAVARVEERALDVLRWAVIRVDAGGADTPGALLDRVGQALAQEADGSDGRPLAIRVEVRGPAACHHEVASDPEKWTEEVRALAAGVGSANIWIERVRFQTSHPADLARVAERDDALGSLVRDIASAGTDATEIAALRASLADLREVLPREILDGDDAFDPHAQGDLSRLIGEARDLLLARIARLESPS